MRVMQDGGVIQDSGFPQDGGMANEEHAKTSLGHGANISYISYNTQAFVHGRSSRGYTFEACISGRFKNVKGSSRSRVVGEVVVHNDGSCTRSSRRGT